MERSKNKSYDYIAALYSQACDNVKIDNESHLQMSKVEGILLQTILKISQASRVLEIGTLYGYSTKFICEAVGSKGSVVTIEKSEKDYKTASLNLRNYNNVNCVNADATVFLKECRTDSMFDAIFIDADKTNYCNYLDLCTPLLKKGGLLIADNTLMYGEVALEEPVKFRKKTIDAIRSFNEKLVESDLYESIIIPTTSGLTLAIKK